LAFNGGHNREMGFDLFAVFAALVEDRSPFWEAHSVGLVKPLDHSGSAASLTCERSSVFAFLVVWTGGDQSGADLITGDRRQALLYNPTKEYEVTSESDLRAVLEE
jgi:hypothetical protein